MDSLSDRRTARARTARSGVRAHRRSARHADFERFAQGSEEYPDRSTTLIVQVERFDGRSPHPRGPGIKTLARFAAEPLPDNFAERLRANHALFPRGVDLDSGRGDAIAALPRSMRVAMEA